LTEPIIRAENVSFSYNAQAVQPVFALADINLEIRRGEYVVIVGHNGSGKSTLAKQLNALLGPTRGDVWVDGMNTKDHQRLLAIRATVGMVFQIPDNQIVATVVEEDVAFGPANLGVPEEELRARVDWALKVVDMDAYRERAPHLLSAGQKQRVAIAGAMAMKPKVLVLDESTSMLDPAGREEVLGAVRYLNSEGTTIVAITHFMHEAVEGSRVIVMEAGRIMSQGTPREVFSQVETLRGRHLDVPQVTELAYELHKRDSTFPADLLTIDEITHEVTRRLRDKESAV
jgi:energy-coupling factor transport system ATP-binding protein